MIEEKRGLINLYYILLIDIKSINSYPEYRKLNSQLLPSFFIKCQEIRQMIKKINLS